MNIKSGICNFVVALIICVAINSPVRAQKYIGLPTIISSLEFSEAGFSETILRCSSLLTLLSVYRMRGEKINDYDEIAEFFQNASTNLPEAGGYTAVAIHLQEGHTRYYANQLKKNRESTDQLIIGDIKADIEACVTVQNLLASRDIKSMFKENGYHSHIIPLSKMIPNNSIPPKLMEETFYNLTRECMLIFMASSVVAKKIGEREENTALEDAGDRSQTAANLMIEILVTREMEQKGVDRTTAAQTLTESLPRTSSSQEKSSNKYTPRSLRCFDAEAKSGDEICTEFLEEILICNSMIDSLQTEIDAD